MRDGQTHHNGLRKSDPWIDAVANRALSVVARTKGGAPRRADPELVAMMRTGLMTSDREACRLTVDTMTENGVTREDIADLYVPEIARQLGDEWCADEISFAEVTIGSSKLQSLLRELGPEWRADHHSAPDAPSALILVDARENHTLGAQVLAGQLRRRGFSVRLIVSAERPEIQECLQRTGYDVVMISTSRPETLESVSKLVNFVRTAARKAPPIVLGGAIDGRGLDIRELSGADYVTTNVDEALRLCGLNHYSQKDARLAPRR